MTSFEIQEQILRTGCWWIDPWWRRAGTLPDDVPVDAFELSIEHVRDVFDAEWLLANRNHPFAWNLTNSGSVGVYSVFLLGQGLLALAQAQGDPSRIYKRLRDPSQYKGASREVLVAAMLAVENLQFRLAESAQADIGGPDFEVLDPARFTVEVTGVCEHESYNRGHELLGRCGELLHRAFGNREFTANINGPDATDVLVTSNPEAAIQDILHRLSGALAEMDARAASISVAGVGTVALSSTGTSLSGPSLPPAKMVLKTLTRALGKRRQLIQGQPGVVIVEYPFPMLALDMIKEQVLRRFETLENHARDYSAVVFIATWQDADGLRIGRFVVKNPFAAVAADALPWSVLRG